MRDPRNKILIAIIKQSNLKKKNEKPNSVQPPVLGNSRMSEGWPTPRTGRK